jgi:CheY-like chemotaxis protein/HPt (histidine-containing phosphotransfer) domain-containing protein
MALVLVKDVGAPAAEPGLFAHELTRPLKQSRLYEAVLGAAPVAAEPDPPLTPLRAGLRVLVAEDNEVNRELVVRQLAALGVAADAVGSGRLAVEATIERPYDAVLMDFQMPEVDGIQAARAIRAIPGARGATPIVAVTGRGSPEERRACLAAGMDDFLQKPISSRDLARALDRVLLAPAIDRHAVDQLDSDLGDHSELCRIAGIYLGQLEAGGETVAAAVSAGEDEALRRAAHRLGSASATFGAGGVADLCRRLEAHGAAGQARAAAGLARAFEAESERAADELRALLELG